MRYGTVRYYWKNFWREEREGERSEKKKQANTCGLVSDRLGSRCKLLNKTYTVDRPSLLLDAIYLSLCVELAFDGTKELLVAVLGVAFIGAQLLERA